MGRLDGKVALIAGGAGAQGQAIARRMGEQGASVVVADLVGDALSRSVEQLIADGVDAMGALLDVTSDDDWHRVVTMIEEDRGRLDVLVNAAAILNRNGVEATTPEVWDEVVAVNQKGAWLGLRNVAPAMRRAGGGAVVLIASIDGLVGKGNAAAYGATKGAIRFLTRTAAVELAVDGIRVNTVCPGVMSNTMSVVVDEGQRTGDRLQQTLLAREGEPDDIAWAVVYLTSDESSFVTGTDLVVDGGYTAH